MHPKIWEASGHTNTFSDRWWIVWDVKGGIGLTKSSSSGTVYHYKGASDRTEFEKITKFMRGEKPARATFERRKTLTR